MVISKKGNRLWDSHPEPKEPLLCGDFVFWSCVYTDRLSSHLLHLPKSKSTVLPKAAKQPKMNLREYESVFAFESSSLFNHLSVLHLIALFFFSRIPWVEVSTHPKPWLGSCPRWVFGTGCCLLARWPVWLAVAE